MKILYYLMSCTLLTACMTQTGLNYSLIQGDNTVLANGYYVAHDKVPPTNLFVNNGVVFTCHPYQLLVFQLKATKLNNEPILIAPDNYGASLSNISAQSFNYLGDKYTKSPVTPQCNDLFNKYGLDV